MSKDIATLIKKEFKKLNWFTLSLFVLAFLAQGAVFIIVVSRLKPDESYLLELGVASVTLVVAAIATFALIETLGNRTAKRAGYLFSKELRYLRAADNRAKSLQIMASKLRATLSFEIVVEEALNVCSLALEEMGIPRKSLAGAVFLYNGSNLYPVTTRRLNANDFSQGIPGEEGIVGKALTQAEITVTDNPRMDPELSQYMVFQKSLTVVCIPLRNED